MRTDPTPSGASVPAERRQAVWPWLLLPLVVLLMFYVLKTAKDSLPPNTSSHAVLPANSAPSEDAESH